LFEFEQLAYVAFGVFVVISVERFGDGLNVLSGETGAGKSIVVDSLLLLAGARASTDLIRSGAEALTVSGVFAPPGDGWRRVLAEAGLEAGAGEATDHGSDPADGGEVLVRREIGHNGRNRVFVNDQPTTLRLLADLAPYLLRIHGQRDEMELLASDLQREWLLGARALLLDGHDTAAAIAAATWARTANIPVIADLDDLYPGVDALLPLIDYLITSLDIPGRISGESDLRKSLPIVRSRFGARLTAATLGHDGVLAYDGAQFHYAPAFRVRAVDTTGAGDIFHAGFLYGLLQGWPLQRQLEFACAAAALNCTGIGARGHIAPLAEIEHLIATGQRHASAFQIQGGTAISGSAP